MDRTLPFLESYEHVEHRNVSGGFVTVGTVERNLSELFSNGNLTTSIYETYHNLGIGRHFNNAVWVLIFPDLECGDQEVIHSFRFGRCFQPYASYDDRVGFDERSDPYRPEYVVAECDRADSGKDGGAAADPDDEDFIIGIEGKRRIEPGMPRQEGRSVSSQDADRLV